MLREEKAAYADREVQLRWAGQGSALPREACGYLGEEHFWLRNKQTNKQTRRKGPGQEDTGVLRDEQRGHHQWSGIKGREKEKSGEAGRFLTTPSLRDQSKGHRILS